MEKEEWKKVEGFEDYEVSNLGRVKSLKNNKEIILKHSVSDVYKTVVLSINGKLKKNRVHQLVAIAFLNHKTCGYKLIVDHINNNKLDNRVENLQIITPRENVCKSQGNHTSIYKGVCYYKRNGKWKSSIYIDKKVIHLGYFITELEASKAYQNKLALL